ncbi:acyl-ACP--UDP-N-acetylglucosamine O-acyltransferase [Crocinitomicaceae bacterium]|nr:acyl-ACP--UDP-N-acetylglucosamine O-acyltransferase [Crocinitomicaceae bacterium]
MISTQSNISKGAKLGKNVRVDSFTTICDNVIIGEGTHIHPNVTIYPGTTIGKNCKIYPGSVIGVEPQDLKFEGEETTVDIGDNTVIRECVTIHRGTKDKWVTKVGSNCLLMTYVHVAHDCQVGDNVILASFVGLAGHNIIEDYAILEGKVGTQQFVRIGAHSFVAGGSLVRKNIPPFVKAAREPIGYAGVNSIGLRRRGFDDEDVKAIEDVYRLLYVMNNNISKGIEAVHEQIPESKVRNQILDFIAESDRGIIRGMI